MNEYMCLGTSMNVCALYCVECMFLCLDVWINAGYLTECNLTQVSATDRAEQIRKRALHTHFWTPRRRRSHTSEERQGSGEKSPREGHRRKRKTRELGAQGTGWAGRGATDKEIWGPLGTLCFLISPEQQDESCDPPLLT